ncbi:dual specificity protein phosphatase CDC14AB isoform X3 [Anarhichas minor]|uniref:dual specificity protein phosphatase CDC14AB isoform X3 n=1 Tax=Anarhichas minor TaxID=65739 RepID=UPI003F740CBC
MGLTELTRKHGVKIPPLFGCSVEECSLAVGELVGHSCVKSAARMNNAVVIFLDSVETAEVVLENGIEVGEHFLPVHPLSSLAVKVTVSNVPPFIRNDAIIRELSKHGKVVSLVRRVSSGFKSPLLKHMVSHRRHVLMIPNNRSREVNLVFKITVEDFDYVIFAKTDDFKCFSCGKEGHLSRACPEKNGSHEDQNQRGTEEGRGDKQDGQEGTSGVQEVRVEETSGAQEVRVEGTSGAQEVRVEETSKAQEVRVEGTSGAQEVRVEGTSKAQEVRVEGTSGAQEVRVEETSGAQEVRESTGGQVETGSEVDMEGDEEQLKAPQLKRKKEGDSGDSQAKKVATKGSRGAAESESSLEEDSESSLEEDSESSLEEDSESSLEEDSESSLEEDSESSLEEDSESSLEEDSESSLEEDSESSLEEDSESSLEEDSESSLEEDSESSLEEDAAADSELSECRAGSCKSSEGYSVEEIKSYLLRSKNVRGAKVEDYFSDKEKLSNSVRSHMSSKDRGGLTEQEGFRLKK